MSLEGRFMLSVVWGYHLVGRFGRRHERSLKVIAHCTLHWAPSTCIVVGLTCVALTCCPVAVLFTVIDARSMELEVLIESTERACGARDFVLWRDGTARGCIRHVPTRRTTQDVAMSCTVWIVLPTKCVQLLHICFSLWVDVYRNGIMAHERSTWHCT